MTTTHAFDLERRERFLALLAVGKSVEEATAIVDVSRPTILRWAARGRVPDAMAEHARFAERFDAIRSQADDVAAQRRPEPAEDPPEHPYRSMIYGWALNGDVFVAASPDELAELTPEQREHVMALAAQRGAKESPQRPLQGRKMRTSTKWGGTAPTARPVTPGGKS
jgi:hypothetical protein